MQTYFIHLVDDPRCLQEEQRYNDKGMFNRSCNWNRPKSRRIHQEDHCRSISRTWVRILNISCMILSCQPTFLSKHCIKILLRSKIQCKTLQNYYYRSKFVLMPCLTLLKTTTSCTSLIVSAAYISLTAYLFPFIFLIVPFFIYTYKVHNWRFIGEETVAGGGNCILTDKPTWIVDPVDGTTNFVHRYITWRVVISFQLFSDKCSAMNLASNNFLTSRRSNKSLCQLHNCRGVS